MIKFNEASLEELSEKFPQIPNRKLTMENSLEDIYEAQELLKQLKKYRGHRKTSKIELTVKK